MSVVFVVVHEMFFLEKKIIEKKTKKKKTKKKSVGEGLAFYRYLVLLSFKDLFICLSG